MTHDIRERKYEWDTLEWRYIDGSDTRVADISLLAGEYLFIELGWEIEGPVRAIISYRENDKHTRVKYRPLPSDKFDIDNALEYPCKSCGAKRNKPCTGDNALCVFRVFLLSGGVL
jgi:hypothetical protein